MKPGYGKKTKAKKFKKIKKKEAADGGEVEMADAATAGNDEAGAAPTSTPRATPEAMAIAHAVATATGKVGTAKERLRAKLQLKRALRVKNLKPSKKKASRSRG